MPPPLTVVANEKGGFEWKPAEYEDERTYSHVVEIAKSGRARCRRCADVPRLCVGKMTRVARPALRRRHAIRSPLAPAPRPPALPAGPPRRCSELIPKGVPRVGVPIKWRGGEYGWISSWTHPACLRVPDVADEAQLAREIHGLETLSKADRELVLGELTSAEPVDLDEVDPNDPAFAVPEGPIARLPPPPRSVARSSPSRRRASVGWSPRKPAPSAAASSPTRWAWERPSRPSR